MVRQSNRTKYARLDLSELDIHASLLEDLRLYVGSPRVYVPLVWDVCVKALRQEGRIILNERDNKELLDDVFSEFFDEFNENKFQMLKDEKRISTRFSDFRQNVAQFYFDIFIIIYPQVAMMVNESIKLAVDPSMINYRAKVQDVFYDVFNDGFGEVQQEVGVSVKIYKENILTTKRLLGEGYGF